MKEILKKIVRILKIEYICRYFYHKIREKHKILFYSTDLKKEKYISKKFKKEVGYEIDFNEIPRTFNQKIQFRKLYDHNPLYAICSDKYRVREYVKEKIGEEYLIPLYLVTDKLTEEQWEKLPNSFVAKANHNSGPVQIVKDKNKINKKEIITELNNQIKLDFGILSMERYYSDIPRKIIVEKFLESSRELPEDFKFNCFNNNGEFKCIIEHFIDRDINDLHKYRSSYYDENWQLLPCEEEGEKYEEIIEKPKNFEKMIKIAKILSNDFEYVRVDLYSIEDKVYFGELTFCEASGYGKIEPVEWDYKFGELWKQRELRNKDEIK